MVTLTIDPHPLLEAAAFLTTFAAPIGETKTPDIVRELLSAGARAPFTADESIRGAVRDLFRQGGYKPTGRGKPSSEYLIRAVAEGVLGAINVAVDTCNAVSYHSGLPISVIDIDRATAPFRLGLANPGEKYVFNASGQEIDLGGLLCLFDAEGPSANGVKDAQRTKTHAGTTKTLSVVWGTSALSGRAKRAAAWYRELLEQAGAKTEIVVE